VCVCVCVCVCAVTFGGHANPVEVAGEFLGHVRLSSSRKPHHHDDGGRVGEVRGAARCVGGGGEGGGNALQRHTRLPLKEPPKARRTSSSSISDLYFRPVLCNPRTARQLLSKNPVSQTTSTTTSTRVLTHVDRWISRTLNQMSMTKLKSRYKHEKFRKCCVSRAYAGLYFERLSVKNILIISNSA